mgnify:FL=1
MKEQIEAVQRMQNYIESRWQESITLAVLSEVSHFSPWYSARLFRKLTGLSPADYIRRYKLSRSALRLRDEDCKVIDVAFDLGFGSVDGYQRAFLREFGCNPREYAAHPVPLYLMTPYGVKYRFTEKEPMNMEQIKNVFIQVIEKPARKVILKRGIQAYDYMTYCNEAGCDVWGLLTSIKSISGEPVCLWLPEQYRPEGTSQYVQGVEVSSDYGGPVPEGFDVIQLPAASFLMFQGEPFEEEDFCQAIQMVQAAMERYDLSVIGLAPDPENPRIQLEPIGTRGYIEMIPVKQAVSSSHSHPAPAVNP